MNNVLQNEFQTVASSRALAPEERLSRWVLVADGDAHRPDLAQDSVGFSGAGMVCEAMLPEIRTVACLIAAERFSFEEGQASPDVFTEEADWFAARILVLGARQFHLDAALAPMLATANRRAAAFAKKRGWGFAPARIAASLRAGRPANMLIVEIGQDRPFVDLGLVGNSRFLRKKLAQNPERGMAF